MSHSTAEDYANAIRSSSNVFGSTRQTNSIRNLSHNTIKYTKSLTIIESRFFESLVENETLSSLASFDNDPENGNQPIRRFYLICRELRRNATKDIINTAVLWFATKFFKKKIAPHSRKCFSRSHCNGNVPTKHHPNQAERPLPMLLPPRHTIFPVERFQW
jgi:hypothetical protein